MAQCIAAAELNKKPDSKLESGFSDCCVSYIICKNHGVDTQIFRFDDAPEVLGGMDAQAVKSELSKIRDAASVISERMSKHLDAVTKAAKSQEAR